MGEQWEGRIKGPTLWLALSRLGALARETILFLSKSITSEAFDP